MAGPYLSAYASEMALREDNRRVSNGEQFKTISGLAARFPVSTKWSLYWQRSAL